jgi:hypothetical protein
LVYNTHGHKLDFIGNSSGRYLYPQIAPILADFSFENFQSAQHLHCTTPALVRLKPHGARERSAVQVSAKSVDYFR